MARTVFVSNRIPNLNRAHSENSFNGGLSSAIYSAIKGTNSVWFGWDGTIVSGEDYTENTKVQDTATGIEQGIISLTVSEYRDHYQGMAGQALWPLLHALPEKIHFRQKYIYANYAVNARLASAVRGHLRKDDNVWVHDFHLFPLATELRKKGWKGPIGFFLHTPFPCMDIVRQNPWSIEIFRHLVNYDLVGSQTNGDTERIRAYLSLSNDNVSEPMPCLGNYPVAIDDKEYLSETQETDIVAILNPEVMSRKLIIGIDRMDYIKGIPQKILILKKMFELYPELRGQVSLLQVIQPTSRNSYYYQQEEKLIRSLAAKLNNEFGTDEWRPVMLEHRNCTRAQLVALFRAAEVCLITSLNDGMNLIAKEYVTARGEESGSLVLSRFTGASEYLNTARIIDPMNQGESALALMQELTGVHTSQRDENWGRMLKVVRNYKSVDWMQSFVSDLVEARQNRIPYGVRPGPLLCRDFNLARESLTP